MVSGSYRNIISACLIQVYRIYSEQTSTAYSELLLWYYLPFPDRPRRNAIGIAQDEGLDIFFQFADFVQRISPY